MARDQLKGGCDPGWIVPGENAEREFTPSHPRAQSEAPPTRRPRILLSVHSAKAGGAERMALAEAEYLKQSNDLIISVPAGPLRPLFAAHGDLTEGTASLPLWGDSMRRWAGRTARTLRQALRLVSVIRRGEIDLVLTNSSVSLAPVLAGRLAGVPVIVHARDVPGSKLAPLIFKLHGALAATVIVISGRLDPSFRTARGARIVQIADGVPLGESRDRGLPQDGVGALEPPIRICVIGGLHPRKGQDLAVEAVCHLRDAGVDAWLDLVGREIDPSFAASVRHLVDRLQISDRVRFLGELDDVPQYLREVDIVVVPSRGEWTPLAIMEAMAQRKPVVAADVGGVSEVVSEGVTGVLIPPEDPHRLARAVADLAADPATMSEMALRGRACVECSFDIGATLEALHREIRRVLFSSGATA